MTGFLRIRRRLAVTVGVVTVLIAITVVAGRGLVVGSSTARCSSLSYRLHRIGRLARGGWLRIL